MDGNGNVTYLLYTNQITAAKYLYDPYGNTLSMSGPLASLNVYRFSSKEWNNSASIYYFGRRYYDPMLQRFVNRDPLAEQGGLNLYAYVANNPINFYDPYGLWTWGGLATGVERGVINADIGLIGGGAAETVLSPVINSIPSNFLPHGGGVIATGSGEGGVVNGAGGTVFGGGGLFFGGDQGAELGGFSGYGGFAGGLGVPTSQTPCNGQTPWVAGGSLGVAAGTYITDATSASQLGGPFSQWNLNTPLVNLSLAVSGSTWIISLTSGPGTSVGASISGYPTVTARAGGLTTSGSPDQYVP
jgi:RHS repeat-associated protein